MEKISMSNEDYLEAIIMLGGTVDEPVKSVDISRKLNVTRTAVNKANAVLQKNIQAAPEILFKLRKIKHGEDLKSEPAAVDGSVIAHPGKGLASKQAGINKYGILTICFYQLSPPFTLQILLFHSSKQEGLAVNSSVILSSFFHVILAYSPSPTSSFTFS